VSCAGTLALGEHRRARRHAAKCGGPLPAGARPAPVCGSPVRHCPLRIRKRIPECRATVGTVRSYLDAGGSSLWTGAVDRGLDQLRLASGLAQRTGNDRLLADSLAALSGALIHQAGARGAEVADLLHRALQAEGPDAASRTAPGAYRELCYLSMQRGVPDRAAGWLDRAMTAAEGFSDQQARILAIQGMLASDNARYEDAVTALKESGKTGQGRREPPPAVVQRGAAGQGRRVERDAGIRVRGQSHRAVLGDEAAAQAVPWLAHEIDNPALAAFLARRHGG
jgi:hypothetical protein